MSSRPVLNQGDHIRNIRANAVALAVDVAELVARELALGPDETIARVLRMAAQIQAYIETGAGQSAVPIAGLGCHICGADPGQAHEHWCPQIRDRAEASGG